MATSLAIALTMAAITACGGGSSESDASSESAAAASTAAASSTASVSEASTTSTTSATNTTSASDTTSTTSIASISSGIGSSAGVASGGPIGASGSDTAPVTTTTSTDSSGSIVVASSGSSGGTSTTTAAKTGMARPASNTGQGFFVSDGKLYDANGQEFRVRGVNHLHWDSPYSTQGIPNSGANAARMTVDFTRAAASSYTEASAALASKIVPIPSNWTGTCKSDTATLSAIVDTWVAQASTWTKLNNNGLINIANEWGPTSTTSTPVPYQANAITPNYTWRDSYIAAIVRMRAAGYTGTLVVDAGSCGQDASTVIRDGAAVLAGDPQQNILFDVHVYGGFAYPATASWQQDFVKTMAALKATGLPIMLGEFGPGNNIGPSPTLIPPATIVSTAEANGWGWLGWAWDDNNLGACQANNLWFSMTINCGAYTTDADLTTFGKTMVPLMKQLAVKATIFN